MRFIFRKQIDERLLGWHKDSYNPIARYHIARPPTAIPDVGPADMVAFTPPIRSQEAGDWWQVYYTNHHKSLRTSQGGIISMTIDRKELFENISRIPDHQKQIDRPGDIFGLDDIKNWLEKVGFKPEQLFSNDALRYWAMNNDFVDMDNIDLFELG